MRTRFRWTGLHASAALPVRLRGEGHLVRVRLRRHFVEPATLAFRVHGRLVATIEVAAETRVPYRVIEIPLPPQEDRPFAVDIETRTAHPAPLGAALDWLEVERREGARFALLPRTPAALAVAVGGGTAAILLAGAPAWVALASAILLVAAATWGAYADVVALERIVRLGAAPLLVVTGLALVLARWPLTRRWLRLEPSWAPGALVCAVALGLALRLALLLHPQFYYPDVKVHALFSWELARRGLVTFVRDYMANQFRYSLGLQIVGAHWYAFPYPPGFYVLTWPLVRLAEFRPEVAVSVLAAAANTLSGLLTWAIARRLAASPAVAAIAAFAHATLPFFLARLTLAYFPALAGQALDALVLLFALSHARELHRPRVAAALAALMTLAVLTYTQSMLNFAVVLGGFAALQLVARDDRDRGTRVRTVLVLAAAGVLATALAIAVFYHRYAGPVAAMSAGVPVAEERILIEKFARQPPDPHAVPEEPDPYAGPELDPWRGIRKAAWRLYVFYGVFAVVVAAGVVLIVRALGQPEWSFAIAWALSYLLLNLASGGLPSPNLVRYNKDLELVAPVFCTALGAVTWSLARRSHIAAALLVGAWLAFSATRAVFYLTEKFVLER